jgi:hypothetical protein
MKLSPRRKTRSALEAPTSTADVSQVCLQKQADWTATHWKGVRPYPPLTGGLAITRTRQPATGACRWTADHLKKEGRLGPSLKNITQR